MSKKLITLSALIFLMQAAQGMKSDAALNSMNMADLNEELTKARTGKIPGRPAQLGAYINKINRALSTASSRVNEGGAPPAGSGGGSVPPVRSGLTDDEQDTVNSASYYENSPFTADATGQGWAQYISGNPEAVQLLRKARWNDARINNLVNRARAAITPTSSGVPHSSTTSSGSAASGTGSGSSIAFVTKSGLARSGTGVWSNAAVKDSYEQVMKSLAELMQTLNTQVGSKQAKKALNEIWQDMSDTVDEHM